ncbi:MAG: YncE family protein, partial [Candidatus Methylomirabilis sp.]
MTVVRTLLLFLTLVVLGVAARADAGGRVYTANMESGTISVVDPDSMKVIATIDARGHRTRDLSLGPDQSKLFVTNMHNGT